MSGINNNDNSSNNNNNNTSVVYLQNASLKCSLYDKVLVNLAIHINYKYPGQGCGNIEPTADILIYIHHSCCAVDILCIQFSFNLRDIHYNYLSDNVLHNWLFPHHCSSVIGVLLYNQMNTWFWHYNVYYLYRRDQWGLVTNVEGLYFPLYYYFKLLFVVVSGLWILLQT